MDLMPCFAINKFLKEIKYCYKIKLISNSQILLKKIREKLINLVKKNMKKIIITGGTGRFGSVLKNTKSKYRTFFQQKKKFNIMNLNSIRLYLKLKNLII